MFKNTITGIPDCGEYVFVTCEDFSHLNEAFGKIKEEQKRTFIELFEKLYLIVILDPDAGHPTEEEYGTAGDEKTDKFLEETA